MAVSKLLQLAKRVINFKALELSGTKRSAGTANLMLKAAHMLLQNRLGWTVMQSHVPAKDSR